MLALCELKCVVNLLHFLLLNKKSCVKSKKTIVNVSVQICLSTNAIASHDQKVENEINVPWNIHFVAFILIGCVCCICYVIGGVAAGLFSVHKV